MFNIKNWFAFRKEKEKEKVFDEQTIEQNKTIFFMTHNISVNDYTFSVDDGLKNVKEWMDIYDYEGKYHYCLWHETGNLDFNYIAGYWNDILDVGCNGSIRTLTKDEALNWCVQHWLKNYRNRGV